MVGTAFAIALVQLDLHKAIFEIPAGIVTVEIDRGKGGNPISATVAAPQPLSLDATVAPEIIAKALRLETNDILVNAHLPIIASVGNAFVIAELTEAAMSRCDPDVTAFRAALAEVPQLGSRFPIHVYCRRGRTLHARMFAPLSGTWEDPATGSANATLACLLLSLEPETMEAQFEIHQGLEMGRPSRLHVNARRTPDGIRATLRGSCVQVMQGEIDYG